MSGITYVNQVGAIGGMNQAAPGTLIPDTFVRFAQDVLFDRAGFIRRRGPFKAFTMYTSANTTDTTAFVESGADYEYVLGVFSTFDPVGVPRVGMMVNSVIGSTVKTIFRVFDKQLKFLGEELLFSNSTISLSVTNKALASNVATLTVGSHNVSVNDVITISGTDTSYTVTNKALTSNVATLTIGTHGIIAGDSVTIAGVDSVFNGTYIITTVGATTISYAKVNANVTSVTATGTVACARYNVFNGIYKVAAVTGTTVSYALVSANVASISAGGIVVDNVSVDSIENLSIMSGRQALGGGMWITFAANPSEPDKHYQFFWRGGYNGAAPAAGPITKTGCVFALNTSVPGGGHGTLNNQITLTTTGLSAGMFVYANYDNGTGLKDYYVGTIKTVDVSTITLDKYPFMWNSNFNSNSTNTATGHLGDATYTASYTNATLKFTSLRPYEDMHGRGVITLDSATTTVLKSGTLGTSGEGHWSSAEVTGWYVYRASDNAFLAKISSVSANDTAALVEHAGILLTGENYIMKPITSTVLTGSSSAAFSSIVSKRSADSFAGLYTAVYAGYQWYGNVANADKDVNRVVFSAYHDKEAVDLSANAADSIVFPGKSQFRGMAAAATGLLVFLEDRTYILRGNDRTNFSVEQLYPEGCLCASSIVEYGGGVFWAGKSGILYYDGASVRNMTKDNLGLYYTDALDTFNPELDRVIAFMHKNNLVVTFTSFKSPFQAIRYEPLYAADWAIRVLNGRTWQELDSTFTYADLNTQNNTPLYWDQRILNDVAASGGTGLGFKWDDGGTSLWQTTSNIYKYAPLRKQTSMTFSIYLPTNALTTFSNMDFRGVTNVETTNGLKTLLGVNSVESAGMRARLVDIHPVYDINTNGEDAYLVEKINIPTSGLVLGPDFYLQTKHYTLGNPILRKWFQRVMLSMLLYDGCLRLDLVDADDNDAIDVTKKKHQYWELFTEEGYSWVYLTDVLFPKITSPDKATWTNVEATTDFWDDLFMTDFNRYKMKTAWRNPSVGFRLYQLNNYKKPYNGVVTTPNRIEMQSFTVGFKALREGRQ